MRFLRRLTSRVRSLHYRLHIRNQNHSKVLVTEADRKEPHSIVYDVTIVAHLYHLEFANDLLQAIQKFKQESGLNTQVLVTTNPDLAPKVSQLNEALQVGASVFLFNNRGRDVYPFVDLAQKRLLSESALVLKIHTKHPRTLSTGVMLDHNLALRLLTPELGQKLLNISASQEFLATEQDYCLDIKHLGANLNQIKKLAQLVGIENLPANFTFPAGTMFWATPSIIQQIAQLNLSENDFAVEPSPADGTMSHAVERFVGVIASTNGADVVTIENLNFESAGK